MLIYVTKGLDDPTFFHLCSLSPNCENSPFTPINFPFNKANRLLDYKSPCLFTDRRLEQDQGSFSEFISCFVLTCLCFLIMMEPWKNKLPVVSVNEVYDVFFSCYLPVSCWCPFLYDISLLLVIFFYFLLSLAQENDNFVSHFRCKRVIPGWQNFFWPPHPPYLVC